MYLVNIQSKDKQTNEVYVCKSSVELVKCIQDNSHPDVVLIVTAVNCYE